MGRPELERWLCGDEPNAPSPADLAKLFGDVPASRPTQQQSIRFVLAVLRDIYADESSVWRWLAQPRRELDDVPAADLLRSDRAVELESLVVAEWNATTSRLTASTA